MSTETAATAATHGVVTDGGAETGADLLALPTKRVTPYDPPPELAWLRAEQPIVKVALPAGGWAWLVTRYEDVRQLLADERLSADPAKPGFPFVRPGLRAAARQERRAGLFLRMDPPDHTRLRRMLTREFMARSIARLEPVIQSIVDELLDAMIAAGPPADLISAFALAMPSRVMCHLLGIPYADHEHFQERSRSLLSRTASVEDVQRLAAELQQYMRDLVDAKITADDPGDDLLGRLVAERVRTGELERDEAVGIGLLLLVAGHENSANMIGLSALTLFEHRAAWQALRTNPETAAPLVEELLRYHTVVHFGVPRAVVAPIEIGGELIRPGEGVLTLLTSANRDDAAFEDAGRFDPRRDATHHVAFGYGIHQCLGQPLARAELRIALLALARRLPELRLAVPESELAFQQDLAHYGVYGLPVAW